MKVTAEIPVHGNGSAPPRSIRCAGADGRRSLLQLLPSFALAACNSQPVNSAMTPPSRPPTPAVSEIADADEHATAEAVVWHGERAIVVGSAGTTETTPGGANPILVDGARYHGWLRGVDAHGAIAWARRVEGGRELHLRAVAPVGDDLVIAGEQRAGDAREYTGWVTRIAGDGSERWRAEGLGAAGATTLQAIAARADGTVVAGGFRRGKAWLVAIDAHGKPGWDHDLAGLDEVTALVAAGDAVVVAGVVGRSTTSAGTSRLIAVDAAGKIRWSTALPERGPGELFGIAALGDGGVAVGQAPDGARDAAWIVRFGPGGAIRSTELVPGKSTDAAHAVAATSDGGFVVAGTSHDDLRGRRATAWRFDGAGRLVWHQAYGSTESFARGVAATAEGGAVVVGATQAAGAKLRPWVIAIDHTGAERWTVP